ncbi:MAG: dipeptidase PepV [Halanaerobiales bacterium]|nr:dipeptidase PepV [Halanaerobiales bacterium]
MKDRIKNSVDSYQEEIVDTLKNLIKFKSVESKAKEGMPFGEGIDLTLRKFLETAEHLDLTTKNVDGYAGHVEIGSGQEILGILCHLDVVPEGSNWTYPPYGGEIHDGKIYGRGSIDDKGPAVASLYALKAIIDSDIKLNKRVRLIVGTDEESGWEGLKYYFKQEEVPDIAFSPDAGYPVIHAEKGILIFDLNFELDIDENISNQSGYKYEVVSLKGGNAPNMVPDTCRTVIKTKHGKSLENIVSKFINKNNYEIEINKINKKYEIITNGISAHGSMPEDGKNAISIMIKLLSELDQLNIGDFVSFYNKKIGMEYYGENIGCDFKDDVSGRLIFNVGQIELLDKMIKTTVNIRYPVTNTKEEVIEKIKDSINSYDVFLELKNHQKPLHVPKDDPLVQNLMKVYREITDDQDSEPIAIGGGTYARAVPKGVAFGALFPGEEKLAHQKDEYIKIDDLYTNTLIIAHAVDALAGQ